MILLRYQLPDVIARLSLCVTVRSMSRPWVLRPKSYLWLVLSSIFDIVFSLGHLTLKIGYPTDTWRILDGYLTDTRRIATECHGA